MFIMTLICGFFYSFFGRYGIYIEYAGPAFPVFSFFVYLYNTITKKPAIEESIKREKNNLDIYCITEKHGKSKKPYSAYDEDPEDPIDKKMKEYPYWNLKPNEGDKILH